MTALVCSIVLTMTTAAPGCQRGGAAIPVPPPRGSQAHILREPREIGRELAAERGWTGRLWGCLDTLWGQRESHWSITAGYRPGYWHAYGVAQALPPSKMASVGADWRTSAWTQIRWGLGYIAERWGDPCNALANSYARGFY